MPGFLVSNKVVDIPLHNLFNDRCVAERLASTQWTADRNTLNKFMEDKTFTESSDFVLILEGILLNKRKLYQKYAVDSVDKLMAKMYLEKGNEFFCEFRGSFSGALYDKAESKWLVFTNHTGDNPVFYLFDGDAFFAGSQVNYLTDLCKKSDFTLTFNEAAAYQMLTYGFMVNDATYANEIHRLRGGTYILHQNGYSEVKTYHTFRKNAERFQNVSEEALITCIDDAFRNAISMEYDKDLEYGYEHLTDLSGGLDSRMVFWVPAAMGYDPIQLITYCKANYADEMIAKEIASYWNDPLMIKPTDDASFLYDIDQITFMNAGLSLYSGISGGNRMLHSMNMDRFGLEHTGMIGDVVIGSWWKSKQDRNSGKVTGLYSDKLVHRLPQEISDYINGFCDFELFLDYSRGFQGAANTFLIRRNYTEVVSAFMDVDLMQLCLDIPQEFRYGHRIYKKWILEKYPDAAHFKWEKTGGRINEPEFLTKLRRIVVRGPLKLLRILGMDSKITTGMVPMDYWIAKNEKIRNYMNHYAENAFKAMRLPISKQLNEDLRYLYEKGNANERTMVLTVLAAMKLYF